MKTFKYFLLIIVGIVVLLLVTGLFVPKEDHVERSIVIQAPVELINKEIKSLKNMDSWSPWKDYDPNMKVTYEGVDGEVGSVSHWDSENVGKGSQEITSISDNKIQTKLIFIEPWESEMTATFILEPKPTGVKVTWASDAINPYPYNVMSLFMNMDEMIRKDFEKGLLYLKEKAESMKVEPKKYNGFTINEIEMGPKIYIAKKATVTFDKIEDFYKKNFPAIKESAVKAGVEPGIPSGLFYRWNVDINTADMAAAIPVSENENISSIKNFERIDVAGGKALHIAFYGPFGKTEAAHSAMDEYMSEKGLNLNGEVIEEYVTDPSTESDPNKWLTNIYYLVK